MASTTLNPYIIFFIWLGTSYAIFFLAKFFILSSLEECSFYFIIFGLLCAYLYNNNASVYLPSRTGSGSAHFFTVNSPMSAPLCFLIAALFWISGFLIRRAYIAKHHDTYNENKAFTATVRVCAGLLGFFLFYLQWTH